MKVFLDDVRQPQDCVHYMHQRIGKKNPLYLEDWIIVRNYKEFVDAVKENYKDIEVISFDHDLADIHYDPTTWTESFEYQEETGYDCAKWLVDFYREKDELLPEIFIHSMNPVGIQNISNVFSKAK